MYCNARVATVQPSEKGFKIDIDKYLSVQVEIGLEKQWSPSAVGSVS